MQRDKHKKNNGEKMTSNDEIREKVLNRIAGRLNYNCTEAVEEAIVLARTDEKEKWRKNLYSTGTQIFLCAKIENAKREGFLEAIKKIEEKALRQTNGTFKDCYMLRKKDFEDISKHGFENSQAKPDKIKKGAEQK